MFQIFYPNLKMLSPKVFPLSILNRISQPKQEMATLKEIAVRLKSIKSIQKITKSMKMVSAAKFSKAERELKNTTGLIQSTRELLEQTDLKIDSSSTGKLIIAISSDRGLCGGIHSSVSKHIKKLLENDKDAKIIVIGDKVRSQLSRNFSSQFVFSISDYGKKPPTFFEASLIATKILNEIKNFSCGTIVFNKFISAVSYDTSSTPIFSNNFLSKTERLNYFESEDENLQSYQEFYLASSIYGAMVEASASEQSARMNAMENATKNAGEMIEKLSLLYNRTRQAVITNELIEIISGAAAV